MDEIIFEIREAEKGGYTAKAIGESIFTEAETLSELKLKIREAVKRHFDEGKVPKRILLRTIRDEELEIDERFAGQLFKYRDFKKTPEWRNKPRGRYRALIQYGLRILTHNELFFSAPSNFNDPFDCKLPIPFQNGSNQDKKKFICDMLEADDKSKVEVENKANRIIQNPNRDFMKGLEEGYINNTVEYYGVLSLTKRHDESLMWSHYADYHKGFVVGFQHNRMEILSKSKLKIYREYVDYKSNIPDWNFYEVCKNKDVNKLIKNLFLTKSYGWKYEREFRVIVFSLDENGNQTSANVGLRFDRSSLACVILGCKILPENRTKIINILKQLSLKIPLYQARKVQTKFALEFLEELY
ncbi:MAG: DUF2971 domain-containing protein [bacterium]|nr:DUF2971 domain-containing protein [bacterium]